MGILIKWRVWSGNAQPAAVQSMRHAAVPRHWRGCLADDDAEVVLTRGDVSMTGHAASVRRPADGAAYGALHVTSQRGARRQAGPSAGQGIVHAVTKMVRFPTSPQHM